MFKGIVSGLVVVLTGVLLSVSSASAGVMSTSIALLEVRDAIGLSSEDRGYLEEMIVAAIEDQVARAASLITPANLRDQEEMAELLKPCSNRECEHDMGLRIGCDYLLASDLTRVRGDWRFRVRAYRIYSNEFLGEDVLMVPGREDLENRVREVMVQACNRILERMGQSGNWQPNPGGATSELDAGASIGASAGSGNPAANAPTVARMDSGVQGQSSAGGAGPASGMTSPGSGTGFALSARHVITNAHVVGTAERMSIIEQDGVSRIARVIGRDVPQDLAVLELPAAVAPLRTWLRLARAATGEFAKSGQKVFVLGYPLPSMLGKDVVITEGIVNSRSGPDGDSTFFQMSVPIQPGNSGSPVISEQGHIVGVVSATLRSTKLLERKGVVAQNVNFAIKSNMLVEVFPWLLDKIPGEEVRQSYFEHVSADGLGDEPAGGRSNRLTAEQIVPLCSPAVVRVVPLKAGVDDKERKSPADTGAALRSGASASDEAASAAPTSPLAEESSDAPGYVVHGDLMWVTSKSGSFERASAAAAACRVGGYSDWRLPSVFEMQSIYAPSQTSIVQYIDADDHDRPISEQIHVAPSIRLQIPTYWTGSLTDRENEAWVFDFRTGTTRAVHFRAGWLGVIFVRSAR